MSKYNTDFAKIYCPSLWKSIHLDVDGYLTPCCIFFRDEDKKYRITDVNLAENVMKEDFQKFRDQLTEGVWPEGCAQCKFAEEEGRASKRIQDMHMVDAGWIKSPPEKVQLEYLQLKTGRLCNLQCTICSPACSTSIATEKLKTGQITRKMYDKLNDQIRWASDLEEFKKLKPCEEGYFRIDIAGGEPLMNKTHFDWLDSLDSPENTQLLYNTNGTQTPTRKEIEIWKKFRGIWLTFSIDSYGEKFEKLRVGAKWDQVLSNLKYCQEEIIAKEFDLHTSNTAIVTTVSRWNVKDVFDLFDIVTNEIDFNHPDPLNFNYLNYPYDMACHNMPKKEIAEVIDLYDNRIPSLPDNSRMKQQCIDLRNSLYSFLTESDKVGPVVC